MIIKFTEQVELEVVNTFDEETEEVDSDTEVFKAGEEVEVDITDYKKGYVDMQFGDGSVAFSVPLCWEVIKFDSAEEEKEFLAAERTCCEP